MSEQLELDPGPVVTLCETPGCYNNVQQGFIMCPVCEQKHIEERQAAARVDNPLEEPLY